MNQLALFSTVAGTKWPLIVRMRTVGHIYQPLQCKGLRSFAQLISGLILSTRRVILAYYPKQSHQNYYNHQGYDSPFLLSYSIGLLLPLESLIQPLYRLTSILTWIDTRQHYIAIIQAYYTILLMALFIILIERLYCWISSPAILDYILSI